jgi:hypothetical protein
MEQLRSRRSNMLRPYYLVQLVQLYEAGLISRDQLQAATVNIYS